MCKGAQKTHKRSGAQAQAKKLITQNGIRKIKRFLMAAPEEKFPGIKRGTKKL
jgi:hypothetical protein